MKICEFTKPEIDFIKANANFTEDEEVIFNLLSRGKSQKELQFILPYSMRTIERKVQMIKRKVVRIFDNQEKLINKPDTENDGREQEHCVRKGNLQDNRHDSD